MSATPNGQERRVRTPFGREDAAEVEASAGHELPIPSPIVAPVTSSSSFMDHELHSRADGEPSEEDAELGPDSQEFGLVGRQLPALSGSAGGGLVVPSSAQMELMLAQCSDVESLANLEKAAAALQAFAKRHDAMKSQLAEISAFHMRARRKLGVLLSQTVKRGGDRSKSHSDTLLDGSLLKSITRSTSSRFQLLAGIPEGVFEGFLRENIGRGRESSLRSALQLAQPSKAASLKKRTPKVRADAGGIPAIMVECVGRALGDIDLCVGPRVVQCRKHIMPGILKDGDLRGVVFMAECHEPERWLPTLLALRKSGKLDQVAVLVGVEPCSAWFRDALRGSWQIGTLPDAACLIAHHGRPEAFRAVMHEMGGVAFRA
jgi:hypothetical protein